MTRPKQVDRLESERTLHVDVEHDTSSLARTEDDDLLPI